MFGLISCCLSVALLVFLYKTIDNFIRKPTLGRLSSRYILVTGCDSGFGKDIAKRLDSLGCNVFAGCLTEAGEVDLAKVSSSNLKTIRLDVSNPDSVKKAFEFVKDKLPRRTGLWGLLNNAGISGRGGPVEWMTMDDYKQVAAVNSYGLIDMTMTFLPLVKEAKGRVVNTASVVGRCAYPGAVPYTVTKYSVEGFTDCLRRQMRSFKVKAIVIEPGFHRTNITSPETVTAQLQKTFDSQSKETKEEFGQAYVTDAAESYVKHSEKMSDKPDDVVDAYEHALLGRFPRARYLVGRDAKYFWRPIQWLPEWLGDLILQLLSNAPVPAAAKRL